MKKAQSKFYILPLPEKRLKIIKGLPDDVSEDEISEELISKGYKVKFTRQFVNSVKIIPNSSYYSRIKSIKQTYIQQKITFLLKLTIIDEIN